jgi:capsular polysaccharide biosynthesis protein
MTINAQIQIKQCKDVHNSLMHDKILGKLHVTEEDKLVVQIQIKTGPKQDATTKANKTSA